MADNVQLNPGALGDVLAADDVGGIKFQRVKPTFGEDGTAVDVSAANPLPVAQSGNGPVNLGFSRFLDTNGDGTGTKNANGNYSGATGTFYLAPPAGVIYRVERMLVTVEDTAGFSAAEYGNLGALLTNGIQVRVHNGTSTVQDLTDGIPVKGNAGWARFCYDADLKAWGVGNEILVARWTFSKMGAPLRLDGDATEALEVLLDDDLTGLVAHYFLAQGVVEDTGT